MSDFDKKFDKLIKHKLEQKLFAPGEQDWLEMEKMIATSKSKRKTIFRWFVSFVLIGVVAVVFQFTDKKADVTGSEVEKASVSSVETTLPDKQNEIQQLNSKSVRSQSEPATEPEKKAKKQVQTEGAGEDKPVINYHVENTTGTVIVSNKKTAPTKPVINSVVDVQSTEHVQPISEAKNVIEEKLTEKPEQKVEVGISTTQSANNLDSVIEHNPTNTVDSISTVSAQVKPDTTPSPPEMDVSNLKPLQSPFMLAVGLNVLAGFNNTKFNNEGLSYSPSVGFGFSKQLKNKFSLNTGLHYLYRNSLNSRKTFSAKNYGFGFTQFDNQLNTKTLHYLQLPVELKYGLGLKHALLVGFYATYMLESNTELSKYETSQSEKLILKTTDETGYNKGFSRVDYGLSAGYQFNTLKRFSFVLKYIYGLTDVTDNSYFGNSVFDQNTGVQFQVQYHFYKKEYIK